MSRSPSDAASAPTGAARALPRPRGNALRRVIGRQPCRVVYADARGVQSWPHGPTAPIEAHADIAAWCAANEGTDARLCVSGHLLHNLLADPTLALDSEDAVRRYARQQFVHYHGAPARDWPLAPWVNATGAGACALHSLDLAGLRTTAARHAVRLRSVVPAWSAGLTSLSAARPSFARTGRRALAVVEGPSLTWLVVDTARIVRLQQRFLDAPQVAALAELLDRLLAETDDLVEPPFVIGWGLQGADAAALPAAQLLAPLGGRAAAMRWLHDAMDGPP